MYMSALHFPNTSDCCSFDPLDADCCAASCKWPDKSPFESNLKSVMKNGSPANVNAPSGCDTWNDVDASSFMDPKQQPRAVDSKRATGYVAVSSLNGKTEKELCCSCLELTFKEGAVKGKSMIVQVINTGADLGENHIDIAIPGGGAGIFTQGCPRQFGSKYKYGDQYGGVDSRDDCARLPSVLKRGCEWRWDWMMNADNPSVSFEQVACPVELVRESGCRRSDAGAPPSAPSKSSCKKRRGDQCGGKNFKGDTCCPSGMKCTYVEPYWSNCQPASVAPSSKTCGTAKWEQCGGKDWQGDKCCPPGSTCKYVNVWYSQCV